MQNIALFASGSGSNAENIIRFFHQHNSIKVSCLLSNNPKAYALERAKNLNIRTYLFDKKDFYESNKVLDILKEEQTDWIVLAGFLWLVPENVLHHYPQRIINIHPALLPNFGGKGMYGQRVHQAVWEAKLQETGITIHFANAHYDEGAVIFQAKTKIEPTDSPEHIAEKVHQLEYEFFPKVIEKTLLSVEPIRGDQ
ncbi:MAG: phosphoribosylglycinamide formyltransferase [Thermonemataceae bacterium]|nr:phosphoribosylglycinamide formyltransferase [Thermonemataceae bacterium]